MKHISQARPLENLLHERELLIQPVDFLMRKTWLRWVMKPPNGGTVDAEARGKDVHAHGNRDVPTLQVEQTVISLCMSCCGA